MRVFGFNFPDLSVNSKHDRILWLKSVKLKSHSLRFLWKTPVLIVINQATGNRSPDLRQLKSDLPVCDLF